LRGSPEQQKHHYRGTHASRRGTMWLSHSSLPLTTRPPSGATPCSQPPCWISFSAPRRSTTRSTETRSRTFICTCFRVSRATRTSEAPSILDVLASPAHLPILTRCVRRCARHSRPAVGRESERVGQRSGMSPDEMVLRRAIGQDQRSSSYWGRSSRISYHDAFDPTSMCAVGVSAGSSINVPYGTRILPS